MFTGKSRELLAANVLFSFTLMCSTSVEIYEIGFNLILSRAGAARAREASLIFPDLP